jgi:hypothetical protein
MAAELVSDTAYRALSSSAWKEFPVETTMQRIQCRYVHPNWSMAVPHR